MKRKKWFYFIFSVLLLLPAFYVIVKQYIDSYFYLGDLGAYCAISRALFEGNIPFPDHFEYLFCYSHGGSVVPIVYPGQMFLFLIPAYLPDFISIIAGRPDRWFRAIHLVYFFSNIVGVFFLIGLTYVKGMSWRWCDLYTPDRKQLIYALSCSLAFYSCSFKESLRWGQIPIVLAICFYCMFWGPVSFCLRTVLFALIALLKYSVLPVVAPLLFLKGHWKLCLAAFSVFLFFTISPVFCGNDLVELYTEYSNAVQLILLPGHLNHYDRVPDGMCHFAFFKIGFINYFLRALAVCVILWLFWRERKTPYLSDTLLLSAFCLTMLVSYHRIYDLVLAYPLFVIRLYDFAGKKQWSLFGITLLFPLFLCLPSSWLFVDIPACFGHIPRADSIVYLCYRIKGLSLFPIMPFFMTALTFWSLYLYFHVKEPYRFVLSGTRKNDSKE